MSLILKKSPNTQNTRHHHTKIYRPRWKHSMWLISPFIQAHSCYKSNQTPMLYCVVWYWRNSETRTTSVCSFRLHSYMAIHRNLQPTIFSLYYEIFGLGCSGIFHHTNPQLGSLLPMIDLYVISQQNVQNCIFTVLGTLHWAIWYISIWWHKFLKTVYK